MKSPSKASRDLIDEISISTLKRKIRELEESKENLNQTEELLKESEEKYSEQGKVAAFHIYLPRIIQTETMEEGQKLTSED